MINLEDINGATLSMTLYDTITNRYVLKLDVAARPEELTRGELTA